MSHLHAFLRRRVLPLSLLLSLFFLSLPLTAEAADRFWVGAGNSNSDRWENTNNWSTAEKGAGGASIPGAGDVAIFSASGNTAQIRSAVSVQGIELKSTWTGSVLQGTGTIVVGTEGILVGSGRLIGGNATIRNAGALRMTGGIISYFQNTLTNSGAFSITSVSGRNPRFTSTGTIILDGNADQNFTIYSSTAATLTNLTLENSGGGTSDDIIVSLTTGNLNLSGSLTITLGNLDLSTNSETLVVESNVTLADAAQATLTTNSDMRVGGNVTVNDAATITVSSNPTLTLNGTADQTVDLDGQQVKNVTLNNSGGGTSDDIIIAGGGLSMSGNLTITAGNLDLTTNSQALSVSGSITLANDTQATLATNSSVTVSGSVTVRPSATFTASAGTTTLDGGNQTLSGSMTFYNLTKSGSTAVTLTFLAGTTTVTVSNTLALHGAGGNLLSLRSTTSGQKWRIDPQGATRTLAYLDVRDSNNVNATVAECTTGCRNSGNNTNWRFVGSGSISGVVFYDDTSNSVYNAATDSGIPNSQVTITGAQLGTGITTTVLTNGSFTFSRLSSGSYVLTVTVPSGKTSAATGPRTSPFTVNLSGAGLSYTTANFGYTAAAPATSTESTTSGGGGRAGGGGGGGGGGVSARTPLEVTPSIPAPPPVSTPPPGALPPWKDFRPTHPHAPAAQRLYEAGIVKGHADGTVRLGGNLSRIEAITLLARTLGVEDQPTQRLPFKDIDRNAWYAGALRAALSLRIVKGFPDRTFRPAMELNLAQSLKLISISLGLADQKEEATSSVWYRPYLSAGKKAGLISGQPNLERKVTRGEFFSWLVKLLQ